MSKKKSKKHKFRKLLNSKCFPSEMWFLRLMKDNINTDIRHQIVLVS